MAISQPACIYFYFRNRGGSIVCDFFKKTSTFKTRWLYTRVPDQTEYVPCNNHMIFSGSIYVHFTALLEFERLLRITFSLCLSAIKRNCVKIQQFHANSCHKAYWQQFSSTILNHVCTETVFVLLSALEVSLYSKANHEKQNPTSGLCAPI